MNNKGLISIGALVAALVIFFAVNIVSGRAFTNARADLTDGKLYTLSPGSRNIAKGIQEPIHLTLYITQKSINELPSIKSYAQRVQEMLEEYARTSNGKIIFNIVDPEPFSEAEDKAVAAGIGGLPTGRGDDRIYFGLAGSNSIDRTETIPFFSPEKEEFLEYDIAKLIYNLSDQPRKTIGLMTWLPLEGSEGNPMMGGRGTPEWQIHKRLKDSFDLKSVATNAKEIPADIKVLVIVHPKSMSEQTQYAIDQFVMRGGRVVVFVDPLCETDVPPGMNQFQAMQVPKNSELPKLLGAWGVEMESGKIATDKNGAVSVNVGQGNRPEIVPYIAFLNLDKSRRSASDPVTGQLERLFLGTAGILKKKDGATTDVQPLITTSKTAMVLDASKISVFPEPKKLLAEYVPGDKELWLAVRATGKAKSAFTGPPADAPSPDAEPKSATPPAAAYIAESAEPINVVVIADCDMLTDRFWVNESRLGNLLLGYDEFTDNGTLVIGAVDHLSGSSDLLSLRARGKFARPFTKIEELKADAQQQYQAKELELQKKVADSERNINELQQKRPDAKDTRVVLTAEQNAEIDKLRKNMVQYRKELREVKFNLDKDTRALQTKLMFLNIGLMPAVIAIFALALAAYRTSRRAADRQTASKG